MIANFFFKSFGSPLWFLYSARSRDLARINYKEKGNRLRLCLFSRIYFLENYFLNFPVFVCYYESWSMENIFRSTENTFQSTETLSGQRKHFPVKEKIGLVSRKVFSVLAMFVFRKVVSGKPLSKLSCVCLTLEKLVNGK